MSDIDFKSEYLNGHLITCLGNKRKLLPFIDEGVNEVKKSLGRNTLSFFDGFSGSGSVARLFKHYATELYVNDLEGYSKTLNCCYLANPCELLYEKIIELIDYLNEYKLVDLYGKGFIENHYAPVDDNDIREHERVFYTNKNAKIIDNVRRLIRTSIENDQKNSTLLSFVLAPLLVKASIHTNTSGVFKGFHKKNGVGHFGGKGEHALLRIKKEISLDYPTFCTHECPVTVIQGDINCVVETLSEVDVAYYDPPYNQHPYGSNYFMLNIINDYDSPEIQNGVSGIVKHWNKSVYNYNRRHEAENAFEDLIEKTPAKYVLISYNDEGIIPVDIFESILKKYGNVQLRTQEYTTYRGSKNFGRDKVLLSGEVRTSKVKEFLWIVKK